MATNPSNAEFENPLDVLAAVASETLRYEIPQPQEPEVSAPITNKRQNKKSSFSVLTFEEIRCMSGKTLIDKFSEMKSDEYTKKYSYKCMLLPEQCAKTFRSFGNEKKAYDELKIHVLQHLDSLTEEYEVNGYTLDAVFVPRSPTSSYKHVERMSKKSLKKQHSSPNGVLHRTNSSKKSKKSPLKADKKKIQETKKYTSVTKNNSNRVNNRLFNEGNENHQECDRENYINYNRVLEHSIYNDADMQDLSNSNAPSCGALLKCLLDHDYTRIEGPKRNKLLPPECEPVYENPFSYPKKRQRIATFESPKFPFVFQPIGPTAAGAIVEVLGSGKQVDYFVSGPVLQSNADQVSDETLSDSEERCSELSLKGSAVCNSVLECVENIENKKHSSSSVPKSEISACENDENLENHKKNEIELALKYIAKMHLKGKKKLADSLKCKICPNKTFTAQATLLHHYRSHAGIKPYSCELCPRKFTRQHSLNYHMLVHKNATRFTCPTCGRTFRHTNHFAEHKRRHTGETPYHCTDCNLHFKTRNTFKRHLKTQHGKLLTAAGIEDLKS